MYGACIRGAVRIDGWYHTLGGICWCAGRQQQFQLQTPCQLALDPAPPLPHSPCRVWGDAGGCPACCFLKGVSGWSRRPAGSLTAGTVIGRGAAAAPQPAQSSPSAPPSPASPPSGGAAIGSSGGAAGAAAAAASGSQSCVVLRDTNLQGSTLAQVEGVADAGACCRQCQQRQDCNVFVYCGRAGG